MKSPALDRYLALRDAPDADPAERERARWAAAYENRGLCDRWIRASSAGTYEDMMQEGILGIHRALERFDPSRGLAFTTYAGWWIRCFVRKAYWTMNSTITIAESRGQLARRLEKLEEHGRLTDADAAKALDCPVSHVRGVRLAGRVVASLDKATSHDERTLQETIPDPRPGAEALLVEGRSHRDVLAAVARLRSRDAEVLLRRAEGETLDQIGATMGLSKERVRQLETRAISDVRKALSKAEEKRGA